MGKGDRKTAKGKRYNSSYGNARGRGVPVVSATPDKAAPAAKKATKTTRTVTKKTVTKAAKSA